MKRVSEVINPRWDIDQNLKNLKKRHSKPVSNDDFLLGKHAQAPELNWKVSLSRKGLTAAVVEPVLEQSWALLPVQDQEVTLSLFELCCVYGPAIAPILQVQVSWLGSNSVTFGRRVLFSPFLTPDKNTHCESVDIHALHHLVLFSFTY